MNNQNRDIELVLSITDKNERTKLAEGRGILEEAKAVWVANKGRFCGQCKHFSQLGGRGSGCNGTCHVVQKSCYTRPSDLACAQFVRFCENGKK